MVIPRMFRLSRIKNSDFLVGFYLTVSELPCFSSIASAASFSQGRL